MKNNINPSIVPVGVELVLRQEGRMDLPKLRSPVQEILCKYHLMTQKPRARDYYGRFLAKNGTGEGSVPRGAPPRDGRGRFVAMKGSRRGVGGGTCVNQYESIVNLQAPDLTTLLGIMDGGRHGIKGSKHYRNIARLQDPGFASVLNAMNNISYKAVDDGPYDVLKVGVALGKKKSSSNVD